MSALVAAANNHRETASNIQRQAQQALSSAEATHGLSSSSMTGAAQEVINDWNSVIGKTVQHLNQMADDLQTTANQLNQGDTDNTQAVRQTASSLGSFL
ncbi:MAG TPA: hypothetical protein VFG87_17715 [Amycolatopsis sp.]|nr:hypothetical protein [Amycolatopsis sp.]